MAAYCRVSSDSDDQRNSFSTQVQHYTQLIQSHPDWEFVDIYADEGITGTARISGTISNALWRTAGPGK